MKDAGKTPFLDDLLLRAAASRRRIVFPEGSEPRVAAAVALLMESGAVEPVLMGVPPEVRSALADVGVDSEALEIVDSSRPAGVDRTAAFLRDRRSGRNDSLEKIEEWSRDPLFQAGRLLAEGHVDGCVAGCVRTTADVVRAALVTVGLADGFSTLSSAFYMVFGDDHPQGARVLTFSDAGVVPEPDEERLCDIAVAAAGARRPIVGDEPRVAFLSYSTKGSAEGARIDTIRAALERFRLRMPDVLVDGELQGDAALSEEVASRKAPGSPLGGAANVLIFPDLGAANIAYKLVQYLGGAVALGPVLQGLRLPSNDLSRGASSADIVHVACITALMAG